MTNSIPVKGFFLAQNWPLGVDYARQLVWLVYLQNCVGVLQQSGPQVHLPVYFRSNLYFFSKPFLHSSDCLNKAQPVIDVSYCFYSMKCRVNVCLVHSTGVLYPCLQSKGKSGLGTGLNRWSVHIIWWCEGFTDPVLNIQNCSQTYYDHWYLKSHL